MHTPDYKKWYYLELLPEPSTTITDLSGYPAPSIFNIVHKLPDGTCFLCGIKAFKNLPIKAREAMLEAQLKPYDIHLNCQDTADVLMGIPIIATTPHKANPISLDFQPVRNLIYVETARKKFEDFLSNLSGLNYLGQHRLPNYRTVNIRKYWIDGDVCFLLSSITRPLALWDVGRDTLINAARNEKLMSAFRKWIEEHKLDNVPIKEVQI